MEIINKSNAAEIIEMSGIVSIIRMDDLPLVCRISNALYEGGIRCFEIPMTATNAAEISRALIDSLPSDAVIGAGTVLDVYGVESMHDAGAQFAVSPHFVSGLAEACKERNMAFIPGAFSPQEIYHAWTSGADMVKVFSIRSLGASYLSDLAGPYPGIKLMPTGGINLRNACSYIAAGACAVTIGRDLIGSAPWDEEALTNISERARILIRDICSVRQS